MMFVLLVLFFLLFKGFNAVDNCTENDHPGNWTCVENGDGTLNLTLDCSLNTHQAPSLWLWSPKFPNNMKALTVENCEEVVLDTTFEMDSSRKSFSHLQVVNVTVLKLIQKSVGHETRHKRTTWEDYFRHRPKILWNYDNNKEENETDYLDSEEMFYEQEPIPQSNLPPNVLFKDIKYMAMKAPLISVKSEEGRWESLKFINTTVEHLDEGFIGKENSVLSLKELTMNNVIILSAAPGTIPLLSKEAEVTIINSTMDLYMNRFLTGDMAKLTIKGNTIKELSKMAIDCTTDEFVFSDNKIEMLPSASSVLLPDQSLQIRSLTVNIHGNVFGFIGDNAFLMITAPRLKSKSNKTRPRRVFNFTNNEIHVLEQLALTLPERDTETFFDVYNVFNNSFDCSCRNIPWFNEIVEGRYQVGKDYLYFTWINKNNPNKCFNVPNCPLNQVMYNFFELCQENYRCPANMSDNSNSNYHFSLMSAERNWRDMINADRAIDDSVKNILKILTDDREEKKSFFQNISQILFKNQNQNYLSLTSNETNGDEQVKIVSLLTITATAVVVILILICFIGLNYSKDAGLLRIPYGGRKWRSYGFSNTEMESQMSLNP